MMRYNLTKQLTSAFSFCLENYVRGFKYYSYVFMKKCHPKNGAGFQGDQMGLVKKSPKI
jgi:hypothetical protein